MNLFQFGQTGSTRYAYNLDNDVRAVTAMAAALVPYIYQDELFGALPGTLPRLTVGGLIMRLKRLHALDASLSDAQRQTVIIAQKQFDDARKEWTVAYEGKLTRELTARLRSLGQLISDCADIRQCIELFPSEMEKRVIVAGLQAEAEAHHVLTPELGAQIANVDSRLKMLTRPGNFLWDARLEAVYPRDLYWYLYAEVQKK